MKDMHRLATPCFIIDTDELSGNIESFKKALSAHSDDAILAYSVKTNSLPYILGYMHDKDIYAEVVSYDEYNLAKYIGFNTDHIIYNGPMKDRETLYDALAGGAYINIETVREIEWLEQYDGPDEDAHIGIRLNIDLDTLSPEDTRPGEGGSRFGFSYENGELKGAIERIEDAGYRLKGLHVHRTSATRSTTVYKNICTYAVEVIRELALDPEFVDVGGGYYGSMPGKPGHKEYADAIYEALKPLDDIQVIVEPGNGLIASVLSYMCEIIDIKHIGDKTILASDGSRTDIDPFFQKTSYNCRLVRNEGHRGSAGVSTGYLTGGTCLEKDIITEISDEDIAVGDRVIFDWEGAYTMALTPNFIRFLPTVYATNGDDLITVRERWTPREWCAGSYIPAAEKADGYLFLNAGRRASLIRDIKKSLGPSARVIATDNWCVAPAIFMADKYYLTPKVNAPDYIDRVLEICRSENIKAVTTCLDPEIEVLAQNRDRFAVLGITVLTPDAETAALCFDKYKMFEYLVSNGIRTVLTFDNLKAFDAAKAEGKIDFPVFIKPRTGSGSVGAEKINTYDELKDRMEHGGYDYIIQEFMDCEDCDADVYIDTITHKVAAAFSKKKIETRIGGASKTISFKDERLFGFIDDIVDKFVFNGPVDMDFFYRDGEYYLSEINPRFGGAYLHGYGAGVDFHRMIRNNICGVPNRRMVGEYEEGSIMLMYDDVVMTKESDLRGDYHD